MPHPPPMRWRRLDVPGREKSRIPLTNTGWRLTGTVEVHEDGVAANFRHIPTSFPA